MEISNVNSKPAEAYASTVNERKALTQEIEDTGGVPYRSYPKHSTALCTTSSLFIFRRLLEKHACFPALNTI